MLEKNQYVLQLIHSTQLRFRVTNDTFTSSQELVLCTYSWTITPRRWRVRDIDAHSEGAVAWKEVAGVFGVRDGIVVKPTPAITVYFILERVDAKCWMLTSIDERSSPPAKL